MKRVVRFEVYGEAQPAGSKTSGVTKDGRRFVRDSNPKSKDWKDRVAKAAGEALDLPLEGPLFMRVHFSRVRPQGHYGAKGLKPSAPKLPITRPDTTKLVRGVEDAMTGIVFRDDAQIVHQTASKWYGDQAKVIIEVIELA